MTKCRESMFDSIERRISNLPWDAFHQGGKGTIMVESSILISRGEYNFCTIKSLVECNDLTNVVGHWLYVRCQTICCYPHRFQGLRNTLRVKSQFSCVWQVQYNVVLHLICSRALHWLEWRSCSLPPTCAQTVASTLEWKWVLLSYQCFWRYLIRRSAGGFCSHREVLQDLLFNSWGSFSKLWDEKTMTGKICSVQFMEKWRDLRHC